MLVITVWEGGIPTSEPEHPVQVQESVELPRQLELEHGSVVTTTDLHGDETRNESTRRSEASPIKVCDLVRA